MEGVDQLGLSFGCLELKFCTDGGGVNADDEVTDENKASAKKNRRASGMSLCSLTKDCLQSSMIIHDHPCSPVVLNARVIPDFSGGRDCRQSALL